MDKAFGKFIDLIYIEGYFEKGSVNGEEFSPKPYFVLKLLKGSVATPDSITFSKPAINGYIGGDSIGSVVEALKNAGYDNELLAKHIEGQYEIKHKDTPTYRNRFKGKNYKEALYEKAKKEFQEITPENMSSILAECFYDATGMGNFQEALKSEGTQSPSKKLVPILEKAAAEPDNRSKASLPPDKYDTSDYSNNSVAARINAMLTKLIRTGRSIAEFKGTSLSDKVFYSKLKNALRQEFEQFTLLSESLPNCNETADSPIVDEIVCLITSLEETDFILTTADYMIESMKNYHIHRLCALITQLQQNQ